MGAVVPRLWPVHLALPIGLLAAVCAISSSALQSPLPVVAVLAALLIAAAYARPLAVTYVATASLPLELYSANFGEGFGVTPTEGLLVSAAVGWSLRRMIERRPVVVPVSVSLPLALLVASVVPGLLVAQDVGAVAKQLFMWSAFLILYLMVVNEGNEYTVRNLLIALAFAGGVSGVIAIAGSAGQQQTLSSFGTLATNRATGPFAQPNLLGLMLGLAIPAQLVLALRGPGRVRPFAWACLVAAVAGLALSLSRAAFLGVAATLVLLLLWRPFRVAAVVALASLVVLSAVGINPAGRLVDENVVVQRFTSTGVATETASDPRVLIYRAAPKLIRAHPLFGVGADNFVSEADDYNLVDPRSGAVLTHAHNTPLAIATELGLLGFAALMWASVAIGRTVLRVCRAEADMVRTLGFGLAGAFAALAVTGLFDHTLTVNAVAALAFLMAGCCVVLGRAADEHGSSAGVR